MTAFEPVTACFIAMKVLSQRSDVGPCVFHILCLSLSLVSVISSGCFFFYGGWSSLLLLIPWQEETRKFPFSYSAFMCCWLTAENPGVTMELFLTRINNSYTLVVWYFHSRSGAVALNIQLWVMFLLKIDSHLFQGEKIGLSIVKLLSIKIWEIIFFSIYSNLLLLFSPCHFVVLCFYVFVFLLVQIGSIVLLRSILRLY